MADSAVARDKCQENIYTYIHIYIYIYVGAVILVLLSRDDKIIKVLGL